MPEEHGTVVAGPQAAFVRRDVGLDHFFQMVGRAAYGSSWSADCIRELSRNAEPRPPVGSKAEMALFVRAQIRAALESRRIVAACALRLPPAPEPPPDEVPPSEDDDFIELDTGGEPVGKSMWAVSGDHWADELDRRTDWGLSRATVEVGHLQRQNVLAPLNRVNAGGQELVAAVMEPLWQVRPDLDLRPEATFPDLPLQIIDADRALRTMLTYPALPSDDWFVRYRRFNSLTMMEAVGAAWRFLAVRKPDPGQRGLEADLVRAMQAYLMDQGVYEDSEGFSGKTLEVVARKILRQLRTPNLSASLLLNSRPSDP